MSPGQDTFAVALFGFYPAQLWALSCKQGLGLSLAPEVFETI